MKAELHTQWFQTYKDQTQSPRILTAVEVKTKQLKCSFISNNSEKEKKKHYSCQVKEDPVDRFALQAHDQNKHIFLSLLFSLIGKNL